MSNYNNNYHKDRTPLQQSMTTDSVDYHSENFPYCMLGVVVDVQVSDHESNTTARSSSARRGFLHTATVYVLSAHGSTGHTIHNVVIPPDACSGYDNYCEQLPRPCSQVVGGGTFDPSFQGMNPYDLDGDWCLVSFVGGRVSSPFLLKYWPHARNPFDPATSGRGNAEETEDDGSTGTTLLQSGRYFRRINGVEYVVTNKGNIYLSTTYTNSQVQPSEPASQGRISRALREPGGDIRCYLKPSSTLELTWDEQKDGIGALGLPDPELPQSNPGTEKSADSSTPINTYVKWNSSSFELEVPDLVTVKSRSRISVESSESATIKSTGAELTLDGTSIIVGDGATEPAVLGDALKTWLTSAVVLTPMGPATFSPASIETFGVGTTLSEKCKIK